MITYSTVFPSNTEFAPFLAMVLFPIVTLFLTILLSDVPVSTIAFEPSGMSIVQFSITQSVRFIIYIAGVEPRLTSHFIASPLTTEPFSLGAILLFTVPP